MLSIGAEAKALKNGLPFVLYKNGVTNESG